MTAWTRASWPHVGGLIAVGFLDEHRVVVGSDSGYGVFSVATGERTERVAEDGYAWLSEDPHGVRYMGRVIPAAGLYGGSLPQATSDGWRCTVSVGTDGLPAGARITSGDCELAVQIDDIEELRACGFSPEGHVFVYATASSVHIFALGLPDTSTR